MTEERMEEDSCWSSWSLRGGIWIEAPIHSIRVPLEVWSHANGKPQAMTHNNVVARLKEAAGRVPATEKAGSSV